jgi:uncharacterized small protein (DUF1192 family)
LIAHFRQVKLCVQDYKKISRRKFKMSFEEDEQFSSVKKNKPFKETNLDGLSVEEIKEYVEHSKKEILRAEAEIKSRESIRGDANLLFKS